MQWNLLWWCWCWFRWTGVPCLPTRCACCWYRVQLRPIYDLYWSSGIKQNHESWKLKVKTIVEPLSNSKGPTAYNGNDAESLTGSVRSYIEAGRTYKVKFQYGAPPAEIDLKLVDADSDTWYRVSLCIGSDNIMVNDVRRSMGPGSFQ